jgi:hypothetical protein
MRRVLVAAVATLISCSGDDEFEPSSRPDYVLQALEQVPGMSAEWIESFDENRIHSFRLRFTQPVDHSQPDGPTFEQHAYLTHRGFNRPMMFRPAGYDLADYDSSCEMCFWLGTNDLEVEHRYYGQSVPGEGYEHLDIWQAAQDHHRFVEALRNRIYYEPWLSTGHSKDGMSAIFHRRYFPDDIDGTIAYVAPILSGLNDDRFPPYLQDVIGTAHCRERLATFQKQLLEKREAIQAKLGYPEWKEEPEVKERDYEMEVVSFPFLFWKRYMVSDCERIPGEDASVEDLAAKLTSIPPERMEKQDKKLALYPFAYQTYTELGAPAETLSHLEPLLKSLTSDPKSWLDPDSPFANLPFNSETMADIALWLEHEARNIIFVYGANDPWTAARVKFHTQPERNIYVHTASDMNHGARVADLSLEEGIDIDAILSEWSYLEATPEVYPRFRQYYLEYLTESRIEASKEE